MASSCRFRWPALLRQVYTRNLFTIPLKNNGNRSLLHNQCKCSSKDATSFSIKFREHISVAQFPLTWSSKSLSTSSNSPLPEWVNGLQQSSDEELLQFLNQVDKSCTVNTVQESSKEKILIDIDRECIRRVAHWDFDTFMQFLQKYCALLDTSTKSKFLLYAMNKRINGALEAPLPTLIEFLRIMNDAKLWFKFTNPKHKLLDSFTVHFHQLNWDEINVFLEPLTIQHCILVDDRLKKDICRKIIDDFDNVNNAILTKFFRLFCSTSTYPKNLLFITPWLLHILDAFTARIHLFDFECVNCAAQLCTKMFIYNEEILQQIAEILLNNLRSLEPSQVATSVSVLTYFNFQPKSMNIYSEIMQVLEEDEMFTKFLTKPRSLMYILANLSVVGVFSPKYLDVVFSDQFQRKLLGKKINAYRVSPELFILHGSSAIECPEYTGSRFDDRLFEVSLRKRKQELPGVLKKHDKIDIRSDKMPNSLRAPRDISTFYRVLYCTRGLLDDLLGGVEFTHVCYLLPQFKRATIIFCLDVDGSPLRIPTDIRDRLIIGRNVLNEKFSWYAISFKSRNIYTQTEEMLMGVDIAKDRQLRQCGFKIISIQQHGWIKTSIEDKLNIISEEIFRESGIKFRV